MADAGLFAVLPFEQFDRVAVLLRPLRVHPQQHLGPIVGVGAAVAGVDRHDRAGRVVPAVEQRFELELFETLLRGALTSPGTSAANDSSSAAISIMAARSSLDLIASSSGVTIEVERLAFFDDGLGPLLVVPEIGGRPSGRRSLAMRVRLVSQSKRVSELEDALADGLGTIDEFFFHARQTLVRPWVATAAAARTQRHYTWVVATRPYLPVPIAALDSQYVARCAGHEWRSRFERRGPFAGGAGARRDRRLHAPWGAVAGGVRGGAGRARSRESVCDHKQGCCTASDAEDARRVADKLGIPFYALNLQAEFVQIIDYFVSEYTAGRTPNPCVQCNNWIKFGKLFDYADSVGAEFVATGHYARLETLADGSTALLRGVDAAKDQSYVLFGIRSRAVAADDVAGGQLREAGDPADGGRYGFACRRQEGQSGDLLCHARAIRRVRARRREMSTTAGELVTTDGTVVGEHEGIESFTVGQRKGLGVAFGERKFVVRIEPESRRVVVGDRDELNRRELTARGCNWLAHGVAITRARAATLLCTDSVQRAGPTG